MMDDSRSERERLFGGIIPALEPSTKQIVNFTGTSAPTTNAVGDNTRFVELYATKTCWVVFGATPTASKAAGFPVIGGHPAVTKRIRAGMKVAAISDGENGELHVTEQR
jgi:hypothetical protein